MKPKDEMISDIKEKLSKKPEKYFVNLFLYKKSEIINPEKSIGLKRLREPIDQVENDMDYILEILKTYISPEQDEGIKEFAHKLSYIVRQIREEQEVGSGECGDTKELKNELRRIIEYIYSSKSPTAIGIAIAEVVRESLKRALNEILEVHITTIGVLLSHLIRLHNLIVCDLRSGISPREDKKVWDYINAINLITLHYGVLVVSSAEKGFSLEDGVIDYLLDEPIEELESDPWIIFRVMPNASWKTHLELIEEIEKEVNSE